MSDFPLADVYPGLSAIPRAGIATLPTPVTRMRPRTPETPSVAILGLKSDDKTSGLYGGNKVRKLDFILGQALAERRRAVITFGAYGSNHALATAIHARALGLKPHVVLTPQPPTRYAEAMLLAHAGQGTVIRVADTQSEALRQAAILRQELTEREGIEPLVIPAGGSSPLGAIGYVNAAFELANQARELTRLLLGGLPKRECVDRLASVGTVYVPAGTLGTAVGLAIGLAATGFPHRVAAVRVTPVEIANQAVAEKLADETVALLRSFDPSFPELQFTDLNIEFIDSAYGDGYAVPTAEALEAVESAAAYGVRLESTYTGKALAAMLGDAFAGQLEGELALFVNTYNSAPLPGPGPMDALPEVLQDYIWECRSRFGSADGTHA
ncbi:MAG: pyridoxal-phosphate dependent enzyme [Coriobacteriia bacterium]|nr:pyridoxal-phosphate dependent enzyme [Coriobacteriia bacterium]